MNEIVLDCDVVELANTTTHTDCLELSESQLFLIGGGIADTIGH